MDITYVRENLLNVCLLHEGDYIIDSSYVEVKNNSAEFVCSYCSGTIIFENEKILIDFNTSDNRLLDTIAQMDLRSQYNYDYEETEYEIWRINTVVDQTVVRSGPGEEYDVVYVLEGKQALTIVEKYYDEDTYDLWGKLKSGMGWINLYDPGMEFVEYTK